MYFLKILYFKQINLKLLGEGNERSAFKAYNLYPALNLVEQWEKKILSGDQEAQETIK